VNLLYLSHAVTAVTVIGATTLDLRVVHASSLLVSPALSIVPK